MLASCPDRNHSRSVIFGLPHGLSFRLACLAGLISLLGVSVQRLNADDIAYETTGGNFFGTVDLDTGAYTNIGNQSYNGTDNIPLSGLGVAPDGNIYGGEFGGHDLFQINVQDGTLTNIGTSSSSDIFYLTGSTTSGLYGVAYNSGYGLLFSIDPTTGATHDIGTQLLPSSAYSTGDTFGGNDVSLSTGSDTLYMTVSNLNGSYSALYTVDTTTGTATEVGSLGANGESALVHIGGMVYEDNKLFGGEDYPSVQVDTIDPSTGTASYFSSYDGESTVGNFQGLAPDVPAGTAVPLPTPFAGALALLAGFGMMLCLPRIRASLQTT